MPEETTSEGIKYVMAPTSEPVIPSKLEEELMSDESVKKLRLQLLRHQLRLEIAETKYRQMALEQSLMEGNKEKRKVVGESF